MRLAPCSVSCISVPGKAENSEYVVGGDVYRPSYPRGTLGGVISVKHPRSSLSAWDSGHHEEVRKEKTSKI